MKHCSDFKYDLKIGVAKEIELLNIFETKTIEVKYDRKAHITKNIFIEYESRDMPSGISKTHADYYCIIIKELFHIIPTDILKQKCRKYLGTSRDKLGGDNNTSRGILLPITEIIY
tara:strand:- start:497 stop:844 length:348 start_codon:yes stop_codon:yes gene_type:complete